MVTFIVEVHPGVSLFDINISYPTKIIERLIIIVQESPKIPPEKKDLGDKALNAQSENIYGYLVFLWMFMLGQESVFYF